MSAIVLDRPRKIYPCADGERLKFCFANRTGEKLYDLWIVTGYDSAVGFTPEIKKIDIRQGGEELDSLDGLEPGDESDNVHVTFIEPIDEGAEFCVTIDFDEDFDDDEWVRFSPTDENDATIITEEAAAASEVERREVATVSRRGGIARNSEAEKRIVARALYRMGSRQALGAIETIRRQRS